MLRPARRPLCRAGGQGPIAGVPGHAGPGDHQRQAHARADGKRSAEVRLKALRVYRPPVTAPTAMVYDTVHPAKSAPAKGL